MPATVGLKYSPEAYPNKWISTRSRKLKGLPFDNIRYEKNRVYKELDKAVYSGTWHAYYFSNGGVHWTAELTLPLWSVYLALGFFFARYIRFRPHRTVPCDPR